MHSEKGEAIREVGSITMLLLMRKYAVYKGRGRELLGF